jgi:hypothetical protein
MHNKIYVFSILFFCLAAEVTAQSSSQLRSRKISEVTVVTKHTDKNGKEKQLTQVTSYNRKGKPLEEKMLRPDGSIRRRTIYQYTYDGKESKKAIYNGENQLLEETATEYHPAFRKRSQVRHFQKGELKSQRRYEYGLDGRKVRELRLNAKGEVVLERRYFYDRRGMLEKREETRPNGEKEEIAYQYEY